jgi:hypothetical protein
MLGTVSDDRGMVLNVKFGRTQFQDFVDKIPTLRSGSGSIQFEDEKKAWSL